MDFDSGFDIIGWLPAYTQEQIRAEPDCSCRLWQARTRGGPIVRAFIDRLPPELQKPGTMVYTRSAWLKAGWWNGSGDYHSDFVGLGSAEKFPVSGGERDRCCAFAAIGGIARTRYLMGKCTVPDPPPGPGRDLSLRRGLEVALANGELEEEAVLEGVMILFGPGDLHRVARAEQAGWRLALRARPEGREHWNPDADPDSRTWVRYNMVDPFTTEGSARARRRFLPYVGREPT